MIASYPPWNWESLSLGLVAWLLTYAFHSTLLLGLVWLIASRRFLRSNLLKDCLWKAALVGGVLTATFQSLSSVQPFSGRFELSRSHLKAAPPTEPSQADLARIKSALENMPSYQLRAGGGHVAIGKLPETKSEPKSSKEDDASTPPNLVFNSDKIYRILPQNIVPGRPRLGWVEGVSAIWILIAAWLMTRLWLTRQKWRRSLHGRRQIADAALLEALARLCEAAGLRHRVWLSSSPHIATPMTLGRAEICLPERALTELNLEQQEIMLAHELAHTVRRDPAWLLLSAALEALFFFQPLNRLARRRLREEAEYLCDDWAVKHTGHDLGLAKCLAQVAEWIQKTQQHELALGLGSQGNLLLRRVQRLLDYEPPSPLGSRRVWRVGSVMALFIVVLWCAPIVKPLDTELKGVKIDGKPVHIITPPNSGRIVIRPGK